MQKVEHLQEKEAPPSSETAGGGKTGWRGIAATLPGIGLALLPKLICPACWPAYAGVLSSLGLGFVNYNPYLFPLTALFLSLAVASLGYRAKSRWGYRPFVLGIVAALTVLVGKFILASEAVLYGGIALLMAASLWNSRQPRKEGSGSCPACASWGGRTK